MSTFVDAVNRILRLEGIIRGDDDAISDFTSTQHAASIEFAKIAVQDEIAWLTEALDIPYEESTGTVTTSASTRLYSLPSDFLRMSHENKLWKLDASGSLEANFVHEADESWIRNNSSAYQSVEGMPVWFYFTGGTSNQIGLYPVPDDSYDYKFWYDKSTNVTTSTDTMPFITVEQFNAFCSSAARVFKFIRLGPSERDALFPGGLEADPVLDSKRATLIRQMNRKKNSNRYGRRYA